MNDLDLIDRHGPAPAALSPDALATARTRLDERIRVVETPRRRWPLLLAAGVAAATALALGPALLGADDVAIARTDPLVFPLTATHLPPGLGAPVFERDGDVTLARYGSVLAGVTLMDVGSDDHWPGLDDAPTADVAGREARVLRSTAHDGPTRSAASLTLVWQERGDWTGVSGRGPYADLDELTAVAESLEPRPQRVRLPLAVAPDGWAPVAFKAGRILTVASPDGDEMTLELHDTGADPAAYGIRTVEKVIVQDSVAWLGRTDETWVLEGRTPEGRVFSLLAPSALTRAQVLEVAGGVGTA